MPDDEVSKVVFSTLLRVRKTQLCLPRPRKRSGSNTHARKIKTDLSESLGVSIQEMIAAKENEGI